ncbi:hypothetical protein INT48_009361, partial [Thamnidium elegans]
TKEKLQELNKKRIEEEKAKARENEIQRREQGKLTQETQQKLQEKQNKLHVEKMKREKKADEEYKKKVKEQIAADRANQIATRKAEKQRLEQNKTAVEEASSSTSSSFYDHSSLNIKQLDGSSLRHSFSSSDTLATVSQWIDISRTDGDMPFKLFAQFPNRNFDIGDEQRTLLELKLCPSGTLIMKPIKNAASAYAGTSSRSSSGGLLNYLYSVGDTVYNSISSVGTTVSSYLVTPTTTPEPGQRLGGPSSSTTSNINTFDSVRYKKDDDGQTYNGNSVNQE